MHKSLILGSEGQIGKPLNSFLKKKGVKTLCIDLELGEQYDLRKKCDLLEYWLKDVDSVYFLAYDIGGSKFLKTQQNDYQFLQNNTKIMSVVFEALEKNKKPFIFASSSMAEMSWSSYGNLKKLGEHFTKSLGGIATRFWNVYGPEHNMERSHVITDFIVSAKENGCIKMLTDGSEARQFLYAEDCANIMYTLMENYNEAKKYKVFDVSSFVWTDIYTIAQMIAKYYDAEIIRPEQKDTVQMDSRIEPKKYPLRNFWDPDDAVSIESGVLQMIEYYEKCASK